MQTERLNITPMTIEETEALIAKTKDTDPELSEAYAEMLAGGKEFPEQALWYLPWKVCLKENDAFVGDICFKGLPESGQPEIGYGIVEEYQGNGYATEAVKAMCQWAMQQSGVRAVECRDSAGQSGIEKCPCLKQGFIRQEKPARRDRVFCSKRDKYQ
ncbi:MAG: GNAT family N-acetyltransferase [Clostridia bacterium]